MVLSAVRPSSPVSMDLVQKTFTVVFNMATSQLRVLDENHDPVRVIVVQEPQVLIFSIQASDLVFNESPIEQLLGNLAPQLSPDKKTLILRVEPPASEIQPIVFNLVADLTNPRVSGIRTSNTFLATLESVPSNVQGHLHYHLSSGLFIFNCGSSLKAGEWLVFLAPPDREDIIVDISLVSTSTEASVVFAESPIAWLTERDAPPAWIQVDRTDDLSD